MAIPCLHFLTSPEPTALEMAICSAYQHEMIEKEGAEAVQDLFNTLNKIDNENPTDFIRAAYALWKSQGSLPTPDAVALKWTEGWESDL